jgi:phage tail sheath protein FI
MILTSNRPGVHVFEGTFGPIPIPVVDHRSMFLVGTALRGPVGEHKLVTSGAGYHALYGRRTSTSYLDDAVRAIFEISGESRVYIQRVVGLNAAIATRMLKKAGTAQVITATVIGAITQNGNAAVIVAAAGLTGSPITLNVPVLNGDSAATVAGKIRAALAANANITARFAVSGAGASIVLTGLVTAANDPTANVSIDNGTCAGLTPAPNSVITTPGVADVDVIQVDAKGPGSDYNYVPGPPKSGVALSYDAAKKILQVYDFSRTTSPAETFYDVDFSRADEKAQQINATSNLVNITWIDDTVNPTSAIIQGLAAGADGDPVIAADIVGDEAATPKTGVYAFADPNLDPGFIMAPGYSQQIVGLALLDVATRFRKLAVIDSTFGIASNVEALITEKQQYASDHGYAVYCAVWVKGYDPEARKVIDLPRSPYRAAQMAASYSNAGSIANVGAGVKFVHPNVTGFEYAHDDIAHDELNRNGVDIPRDFSRWNRGPVSFSARTVSADELFKLNSVRVIMNTVEASLERALLDEVFEVIDGEGRLAGKIVARIENYLHPLWKEGVLFGTSPRDAYKVEALTDDRTLLDQGILGFNVYIKPSPVAERIVVTVFRTALSVTFADNTIPAGEVPAR